PRARKLLDSLQPARVRGAGPRVDSSLARLRVLQPVSRQLVLRRPARELVAPDVRLRLVVCDDLAGDLRGRRAGRGAQGRTGRKGGKGRKFFSSCPSCPS